MYTQAEERAAKRALMSRPTHEERRRFVERELDIDAARAEAILAEVSAEADAKQARTRAFVDVMASAGEDLNRSLAVFQLLLAAAAGAFAWWLFSSGRWFLGIVAGGLVIVCVIFAVRAYRQPRRRT